MKRIDHEVHEGSEEKNQAMEMMWDDLPKNGEQFKSPDWHQGVLAQRESEINEGSAEYGDWSTAKKIIKDQCEYKNKG